MRGQVRSSTLPGLTFEVLDEETVLVGGVALPEVMTVRMLTWFEENTAAWERWQTVKSGIRPPWEPRPSHCGLPFCGAERSAFLLDIGYPWAQAEFDARDVSVRCNCRAIPPLPEYLGESYDLGPA